ncbi:MAG: head-tail connector protein [Pseudomonadota bacterium]
MSLTLTAPPAEEPVSLADLKAHLRVDGAAEDALISGLGVAARRSIEARFGVAMVAQSWRLALDAPIPCAVELPIGPIASIDAIVSIGANGEEPLATNLYETATGDIGRVAFNAAIAAPRKLNAVVIDFTAGHPGANETPEPMRLAVMALAAHYYEFREEAGVDRFHTSPQSLNALMAPWRRVRV